MTKTLFTAEVISEGGRSGTLHNPAGLLDVTLGNPLEKGLELRGPNPELLFAGPIMAALGGAAIGATVGGIAGGLIGLGIPEIEAKRYEGKLKEGNILISVHTDDSGEVARAKQIFTDTRAQDICTTGESATPDGHTVTMGGGYAIPDRSRDIRDTPTRILHPLPTAPVRVVGGV